MSIYTLIDGTSIKPLSLLISNTPRLVRRLWMAIVAPIQDETIAGSLPSLTTFSIPT